MKIYLVGGFLGSGKTTAIAKASQSLAKEGKVAAVITNDQGTELVDSLYMRSLHIPVCEVVNGCFCCNYNHLNDRITTLINDVNPEIIFAESVGSCTDIIATVVNPLLRFSPEVQVVLSVFADAVLLQQMLDEDADPFDSSVKYIYEKQIEEADLLVMNKKDILTETALTKMSIQLSKKYPGKKILHQCSFDDESVDIWLQELHQFKAAHTRQSLDIDYEVYGKGEGMLAWLDENIEVRSKYDDAPGKSIELAHAINKTINNKKIPVGHLKFLLHDGKQQKKISFTPTNDQIPVATTITNQSSYASLLINARVQTSPDDLRKIVNEALNAIQVQDGYSILVKDALVFSPGFPKPTYRIKS